MGFFSNLFGGGKPKEAKAAPAAAGTKAVEPVKAEAAKAVVSAPAPAVLKGESTGAVQARLRLRLAAAARSGDVEAAYYAAKGLADIQAKAGRRVGARIWREEAERIITGA